MLEFGDHVHECDIEVVQHRLCSYARVGFRKVLEMVIDPRSRSMKFIVRGTKAGNELPLQCFTTLEDALLAYNDLGFALKEVHIACRVCGGRNARLVASWVTTKTCPNCNSEHISVELVREH